MPSNRPVVFPPLEADSLFLRLTIGCSYNLCSFCCTYRDAIFRERKFSEIEAEVKKVRKRFENEIRRVIIGEGDALVAEPKLIRNTLGLFRESFPKLLQVGIYATPRSLLDKTPKTLAGLRAAGLETVYMGLESGSDAVLERLNKGVTAGEILTASRKAIDAGLKLSVHVILGAGGHRAWREHVEKTGKLLSEIDPQTIIMLTLKLIPNTPLFDEARRGDFAAPTPVESILELKGLITAINVTGTVFKSSHASNYLKVSGTLPEDKEKMLHQLERVINNPTEEFFNPEYFRGS